MTPHPHEAIFELAELLTRACRQAGLPAEQYGAKVRIIGISNLLTEEVECRPDSHGNLRWWWSWAKPITSRRNSDRILTPDDLDDLVDAIRHVVGILQP